MEYNGNILYSFRTKKTNYFKILKLFKNNKYPDKLGKTIYKPINPLHHFNSQLISPTEITKKKNAHLIINNAIKDILDKYNKDNKKKNNNTFKNHRYFYNKFKDEDKKYYMALKAIAKKDFDNWPKFLSEKKDYKKNKLNLKIAVSRNKYKNLDKFSSYNKSSDLMTTASQIKGFKTEINFRKTQGIFQYTDRNKKNKNFLINEPIKFSNLNIKLKFIKKATTKKETNYIKKTKLKNINNLNIKKQLSFSITNMISAKLGIISLFGVFEDIGPCGKMISSLLINYLIDYFEKSKEMIVCLEKNNFYSIMHWSFVNAQKYLIKNAKKYHIDLFNSGCIGTILLIPKNNKNIFYCANSGKCKCILYTNRGIDTLFLTTIIDRASEKERIFNNIKINKIKKLKKNLKKKQISNLNERKSNKSEIDNQKEDEKEKEKDANTEKEADNVITEEEINLINREEKINELNYIKYFKELGTTRCLGLLSGIDMGLSPDPEVTECDIKAYKVKYAVLGNTIFWKYLDEKEVRFIVSKYLDNNDTAAATKEIEELIKQKVGISSKILIDSSFVVVYFDTII